MYVALLLPIIGVNFMFRIGLGVEEWVSYFGFLKLGTKLRLWQSPEAHEQVAHRNYGYVRERVRGDWGILIAWRNGGLECTTSSRAVSRVFKGAFKRIRELYDVEDLTPPVA